MAGAHPAASAKRPAVNRHPDQRPPDPDDTACPQCGESHDLAKVKGCIKCLKCGYKFDCNGW